jgi:anti-anti-sigma factor
MGELRDQRRVRSDVFAGLTVALVLIPQSMAYAQLAGLPVYYGLYAAFLPPMVAALFGSSRQLATGPVAMVSLLTAAGLEPIATAGSDAYVAYAILLALIVGVFQLALGLVRLGAMVNFLAHPVVLGFTNAAAIIIATSQLDKIFGVVVEKTPQHYQTVWNTLVAAYTSTHFPTLAIAVLAFALMVLSHRVAPKLPAILIAVATTTIIAWLIDYEKVRTTAMVQLLSTAVHEVAQQTLALKREINDLSKELVAARRHHAETLSQYGQDDDRTLSALHTVDLLRLKLQRRKQTSAANLRELRTLRFDYVPGETQQPGMFYLKGHAPKQTDGEAWRLVRIEENGALVMHAGGTVVAIIPPGLPSLRPPRLNVSVLLQLVPVALVIALIGFAEAYAVAKAMAARTRLSNIFGSFFQSYAVSGSFSRSAVNIRAGAMTGFSSVVTGLVVAVTLLWLTPLLYHVPHATLAAVIMMAVIGLVNIQAFRHLWRTHRPDAIVALTTLVFTLALAPDLEWGITMGIILSLGLHVYRTMRPRVAVLSRHPDGSFRDAEVHDLKTCENISIIRFDGSLYFGNAYYFEQKIIEKLAKKSRLRYVIVDAEGINQMDASGEEMLAALTERLNEADIKIIFARVKKQIMDLLQHSGFVDHFGEDRFFHRVEFAVAHAWAALGDEHHADCPLKNPQAR